VSQAADGVEALARLEDRPDVVLTDLRMPRLDGLGLLRRFRSGPTRRASSCSPRTATRRRRWRR
jgi:CheY-like chemotaxis protein